MWIAKRRTRCWNRMRTVEVVEEGYRWKFLIQIGLGGGEWSGDRKPLKGITYGQLFPSCGSSFNGFALGCLKDWLEGLYSAGNLLQNEYPLDVL